MHCYRRSAPLGVALSMAMVVTRRLKKVGHGGRGTLRPPKLPTKPRDPREKLRARAKSRALMRRAGGKLALSRAGGQYASATAQEVRSARDELMQEFPRAAF
jgi:hypothetical protein